MTMNQPNQPQQQRKGMSPLMKTVGVGAALVGGGLLARKFLKAPGLGAGGATAAKSTAGAAGAAGALPKSTAGAAGAVGGAPKASSGPSWLKNVTSKADAKKAYRQQAFQFHPDRGGSAGQMANINAEWDAFQKSDAFNKLSQVRMWAFADELEKIAFNRS